MQTRFLAALLVMKDGSVKYTIQSAKGELLIAGGTRSKKPPKDPIKTACVAVERMLRGLLAQKG